MLIKINVMINFEYLEKNLNELRIDYLTAQPFPHLMIDDFCDSEKLNSAYQAIPELNNKSRDYAFANHFKGSNGMPEIKNIFNQDISQEAFASKDGFELINSDFLNGLGYKAATKKIIEELEKIHHGKGKTNYRLRDAVFSRQRYWGEPFPVYFESII